MELMMRDASEHASDARPYVVVVDGAKHREWGRYRTNDEAQAACRALRKHGMLARIETVDGDQPEHRGERRRFLVAMLMLGAIPPQRMTERIVAELDREAAS